MSETREWTGFEIAVIGMAGRFPGAPDLSALWRNLCGGVESIRRLAPEELVALGRSAAEVAAPNFVPAHGVLDDFDRFDAEFFGYRPREAEAIDPQHRIFLEVVWEAIENAGYDPRRYPGLIGIFAGASVDDYLQEQLRGNPEALARIGEFQAAYSNVVDHLTLRVSYKLNLRGPSLAVQSACSTSLVAVHLACQQLITGSCDMAVAGGVSLTLPQHWGYHHQDGMIFSPDGHCRAFDADAQGCLKGDGAGAVLLKRLSDALEDGDPIQAVILASAANNDGAAKAGYTAPGLDGQIRLIETAHTLAEVSAQSIGLIEAHGTGTPLGDPIEIGALTQAFRRSTPERQFCGIGSIKTNIGHLDAAAGVAGLIKAVLALKHRVLPPSLNFRTPNPQLALEQSPFFVVAAPTPWVSPAGPRRAGVSSFGIGGTNAHVVLQEAPDLEAQSATDEPRLLVLSASTAAGLERMTENLAAHLEAHPDIALRDVAFTLLEGRGRFARRRAVVAASALAGAAALRDPRSWIDGDAGRGPPNLVFLFPGQGAQYLGMGRDLYRGEPAFRAVVDDCAERLLPLLHVDLREAVFCVDAATDEPTLEARLRQTALAQPALFVVEYALASFLMGLGLQPAAMAGHSLGEWVAACVAGVFTLDEALALVVERGRLMQRQAPGTMLSVPISREELLPLLGTELSLAAENAPRLCVVAGPDAAVAALANELAARYSVECTPLRTSHAFHSAMMEPMLAPFLELLARVPRRAPVLPYVSTVTGHWVDADEVQGTTLWHGNIRGTVQFAQAAQVLLGLDNPVFLEVGPGTTLSGLLRRQADLRAAPVVAACLRHPADTADDRAILRAALGRLWTQGVELGAATLGPSPCRRLPLPGYAFVRQRHWVDAAPKATLLAAPTRRPSDQWYYVPGWTRSPPPLGARRPTGSWLVAGSAPAAELLAGRIRDLGGPAESISLQQLDTAQAWGEHLLFLVPEEAGDGGFAHLLACAQRWTRDGLAHPRRLTLVAGCAWSVTGDESIVPERALGHAFTLVLPQELDDIGCQFVDVDLRDARWPDQVLGEALLEAPDRLVAYRAGQRWRQTMEPLPLLPGAAAGNAGLRAGGVYLITGGLGGMGLALAEELARTVQARLVLVGRRGLPDRATWASLEGAEDDIGQRIRAVLRIEQAGGEVMVLAADVADANAMATVREQAHARFGPLCGIIHAAGVPGGALIAMQDAVAIDQVLSPKVRGLQSLLRAFGDQPLEFLLLCSSLTSLIGRAGRLEYTAANLYLDAVAQSSRALRILSVNWDNWVEAGMAREAATGVLEGLTHAEGARALRVALTQNSPQIVVSTLDLGPRMAGSSSTKLGAALRPGVAADSALPSATDARADPSPPFLAAQSATEKTLVSVWQDLLGVPRVGVDDDFFDLGGDSVVSIQLCGRARRAGLNMGVKQVFELRTIARIARALDAATPAPISTGGSLDALRGPVPLTPVQCWFFDLPLLHRRHWGISLRATAAPGFVGEALTKAWAQGILRHDVFALRFRQANTWIQELGPRAVPPLRVMDLTGLAPEQRAAMMDEAEREAQASLDLSDGPLVRGVLFDQGPGNAGHLLLVAHHLVADVIALRTLLTDLNEAYPACLAGKDVALAPLTPFTVWARRLREHAASAQLATHLDYWTALARTAPVRLPLDFPAAENREGDTRHLRASLDAEATRSLAARGGPGVVAALLGALANSLGRWSGAEDVWFDIEGHGRESFAEDLDVSRTVGWFTSLYPLVASTGRNPSDARDLAASALDAVRPHGFAYGLLRYLRRDAVGSGRLASIAHPEIVFLYQGAMEDSSAARDQILQLESVGSPWCRAPEEHRGHVFELNAWISQGALQLEWRFSTQLHREETVRRLLDATLGALLELSGRRAVSAAPERHPLSFAQERIWFVEQLEAGTAIYNKQVLLDLAGPLQPDRLGQALQALSLRHASLRTRFVLEDSLPVQEVLPAAVAPSLNAHEVADEAQAALLSEQWARLPFDLAAAAPWRVGLLRFSDERHRLVLTLHHIITDAWSMQILVGELGTLYRTLAQGYSGALAPLPTDFARFARWQRQWLSGERLARLQAFWVDRLAGLQPLELATDYPRPAIQRFEGARVPLRWPASLTPALKACGREAGASLFMVLLSVFKLLLARHTGQTDIAVGVPAADRPQDDLEGLVGPFVNNLVLRTDLSGELSFQGLLRRVRDGVLSANEYRELPFEKLVEALRPERDRSRSPLFQVSFSFMNVPAGVVNWGEVAVRAREAHAGNAEFDLGLYCYDPSAGPDARVEGWLEYSTALFERATVERLAAQLEVLAAAVVDTPTEAVWGLPLLPAVERNRLLVEWNATQAVRPEGETLHGLLQAQAARTPEAPALTCEDRSLSYGELDRLSNQVAHALRELGVHPDDLVAVFMERSSAMMVALLGILKAGGAYVPVDPSYPEARIAHMLEDSGARLILTQDSLRGRLPAAHPGVLCLDSGWSALSAQPPSAPAPAAGPDNLAYVIYTSGSTGRPKGVQIEHRAVVNFLHAMRERPGLGAGDTLLAVTTISFDIHVLELFLPLAVGGRILLAGRDSITDPGRLGRLLEDATVMQATPSTWRMLLDSGWRGKRSLKVLCGGERLPTDIIAPLLDGCGELWNMYGPTEATVWACIDPVVDASLSVTVGRPFDNMRAYILDRNQQLLPQGARGELWIGGSGVARGYLRREELTAERFRADPFAGDGRIYATGDLARFLGDGRIEILGRLDNQVKLRGHRVELGEVEAALTAHPAVSQCCARVREDRPGDQRLVAYLVARGNTRPDLGELRAFASAELPAFMLPSALMWLEALPVTPNGKVDQRALPAPQDPTVSNAAPDGQAMTPVEQLVADIFGEVLGQTGVGRFDNFFDLGGHSLLSMKVVDRFEAATGIRMQPGELFQQSVGQIAACYAQRLAAAPDDAAAEAARKAPGGRLGDALRSLFRREPRR